MQKVRLSLFGPILQDQAAKALALRRSDSLRRRATARNVSLRSLYRGQFTLSTQLMKPNYLILGRPTSFDMKIIVSSAKNSVLQAASFGANRAKVDFDTNLPRCFLNRGFNV